MGDELGVGRKRLTTKNMVAVMMTVDHVTNRSVSHLANHLDKPLSVGLRALRISGQHSVIGNHKQGTMG